MKIYLGGSIHGGREFAEGLRLICGVLKEMGHEVLTEDFVVNHEESLREFPTDYSEIVSRDMGKVTEADCLIAEVSQGSHGVGYEHCFAEYLGKPILLLRHVSLALEGSRSAFLTGTNYPNLRFSYYDESGIRKLLEGFFVEFFPEASEGRIIRERG